MLEDEKVREKLNGMDYDQLQKLIEDCARRRKNNLYKQTCFQTEDYFKLRDLCHWSHNMKFYDHMDT